MVGRAPRLLFLGLDGAGKTAVVELLALRGNWAFNGRAPMCVSTAERRERQLELEGGQRFVAMDCPGRSRARRGWADAVEEARPCGAVFVVDASRPGSRLVQAREALQRLLGVSEPFAALPLLVLANKQDRSGAVGVGVVAEALGLRGGDHGGGCCVAADAEVLEFAATEGRGGRGWVGLERWLAAAVGGGRRRGRSRAGSKLLLPRAGSKASLL